MHALLALALLLPSPPAYADDMASNTLSGITGALNGVNGFFSSYGSSTIQLQALASQLSQLQQSASGLQTQQSMLNQLGVEMNMAMMEAQSCYQQSTRSYEKYYAKRKGKQAEAVRTITTDTLTAVEPTCETTGVILDAIALNKAKMEDANKKMACLTNLQNKINELAERAKAPFQSLNDAAREVYDTHTSIIDVHKKIAAKLSAELDGPDGKGGGYRDQLKNLEAMALNLNNVLNAKQGDGKDGMKTGLVKQVENLHNLRAAAANEWYFNLMQDVEGCFQSRPAPCFNNNISAPPAQCIGMMIANQAEGISTGQRVLGNEDLKKGLPNIGLQNNMNMQEINLPANIDVTKPDEFLSFTKERFDETLTSVLANYGGHQFASNVDKAQLSAFVNQSYMACYDIAVKGFKSDMISQGGRYFAKLQGVKDFERETANDIKNQIDIVSKAMSEFKTSFEKTYDSKLSQFNNDCTAGDDPYQGLNCLRVYKAMIDSGINGTRTSAQLSNGATWTVNAGLTVLPVQTLSLDANGKAVTGTASATCSGFEDCINYMDRTVEQHNSAAQTEEEARTTFVQQNNKVVKAMFNAVGDQFSKIGQMIVAGVKGINEQLVAIGIKATIKTKNVEGEALVENDKTGMIDMPKSMKAAFASRTSYTEIDSMDDVTSAYNSLAGDLNKKAADAQKMAIKCKVTKSNYDALLRIMPKDCSDTHAICARDKSLSSMGTMEDLLKRSSVSIDDTTTKSAASSEYNSCKREIMSDSQTVSMSDRRLSASAHGLELYDKVTHVKRDEDYEAAEAEAVNDKKSEARQRIRDECSDVIFQELNGEAGNGREGLREQNQAIVAKLQDVTSACSRLETDAATAGKNMPEDEDVTSACEDFKSAVNAATPPQGEEATNAASTGTSTNMSINPINLPTPMSATPAK